MLTELHIRNFAIIDDLHLTFGPGLNILTGETGAGKSIIIDALGLLLGDRAAADWVRAGSERAEIEATFALPPTTDGPGVKVEADAETHAEVNAEARAEADVEAQAEANIDVRLMLAEQGLDDPDASEWAVLSREVRLTGRNVCRVNGRAVNLQILADVAGRLIDVHGQGEHLNLLQPRTHIHLLDRYGGLLAERAVVAERVRELRTVRGELNRLRQDARTVAQRLDLLNYQVEEIFEAALQPGEDEELENERRRLGNAEALLKLAQAATAILDEGDDGMPSALDLVSEAVGRVEKLAQIDPSMAETAGEGQGVLDLLAELSRTLQDYAEELEFNPERLEEVEERIDLLNNLKRKYGDTIEQINAFGERAQGELEELSNWEGRTAHLEKREAALLHEIGKLGAALSERRRAAGEQMARQVEQELEDLRMAKAHFGVAVEQSLRDDGAILPDERRVAFDATGVDRVEFLLSSNPGEPLKPMAKVASGGETARLMLALKSVLAHVDATPTLIFDEIDQGIGGRVGAVVGQKLWGLTGAGEQGSGGAKEKSKGKKRATKKKAELAQNRAVEAQHQVLCITHLPQLAAFGDQHLTVNKQIRAENGEERTSTVVTTLAGDARVEELMQMLGATTEAGRRSVEEMMAEVARVKGLG